MAEAVWQGRPLARRQFVIGGAAMLTVGAGLALVPRRRPVLLPSGVLAKVIPERLGEWGPADNAQFVLPLEDEGVKGVYSDVLTRTYANSAGAVVMLVIAYAGGQIGTIVVHRPEACYPANGFTLSNRADLVVTDAASRRAIPAISYTAKSYDHTEQLLYWTRIGTYFPVDWLTEQIALARSNIAGRLPDGALVRISVDSDDPVAARAVLLDFAAALSKGVTTLGRAVLFNGAMTDQPT